MIESNYIGNQVSAEGSTTFHGINPVDGTKLPGAFHEATLREINAAVEKAENAFIIVKEINNPQRADFLEQIAAEILALDDILIQRAMAETGLPEGRLIGERGRTMNQLKLFASVVREGSWVNARIDPAIPDRSPFPRVDIRSMLRPLGPVAIFGASNFPLAFSVAGGDTASALAAGCSIVVKAHPAHPGTSALVASAIIKAANSTGMPDGIFSLLHGTGHEVGGTLVAHPLIQAVGFTGSLKGGRALFDIASHRPHPIPVYAEMGSTNPVFILPEALANSKNEIAEGFANSLNLGVGQFCTNPGLLITHQSKDSQMFLDDLSNLVENSNSATMLTPGINKAYKSGIEQIKSQSGVTFLAQGQGENQLNHGYACLFSTEGKEFLDNKVLEEEVFGPSTLHISASDKNELLEIASSLSGHLTATIHGTPEDLNTHKDLVHILERKVGRVLINGYPTGVEVNHAMVHGGPYPATTDSRSTSVGTSAIRRFARPVCYQNFPDHLLPEELQEANPLGVKRMINGAIL